MTNSKPETAIPRNGLVMLLSEEQRRLSNFGRVAVNADLIASKPPRFHEGMTLDDAVVITGLPREEADRRIREMQKQDDPKLYAARQLAEGAGKDYAGQAQKPKTADVIQLAFWGEDYRAAPNAFFRSALFPALRGKDKENRRYLENEEVFCVGGLKIFFTGKQFDQSDLDVYLEILNIARQYPLGSPVEFSAYSLLKALGLTMGKDNYTHLHAVIIRLCGGVLDATDHGKRYFGVLIEGGSRDDVTLNYKIRLNRDFAVLFTSGLWSKFDLETRRAMGRNPTAKSLHGYFATHVNPSMHNIETLCNIAGIHGKNRKSTILKALGVMKDAGFMDYKPVGDAILPLEIDHTPSQQRAIAKKAEQQGPKTSPRRRNKPTRAGDLLPRMPES